MFGKRLSLLALAALALEVTSVSAQACVNFAFAPAGTCNSDLNSAERLRADLVQDRIVPGCANGGVYTVIAQYVDLGGAKRWVSAIEEATVAEDFTGTIPFSFKVAQSTISAGPVTLSIMGTNRGGAFTSRITYSHVHTPTVTYTTATSTTTAWVSSTVTSTSYLDVTSWTTVNPPGGVTTVTKSGVSTSIVTKPTVVVTSWMQVDDKTVTEITTSRQTISSSCVSARLVQLPSVAAAAPTPQRKLRRNELERLYKRAQPTTYSVPYCGSTFSTTMLPISTVYLQTRSTLVDTITRIANNVNWLTVIANNPTVWVNVTSILTKTGTTDARTVTSLFTAPRITATETFTDTLTTTVYPPGSPVCNAEVVPPTQRVAVQFTGSNTAFSLPSAASAGASNFYGGNQMTLPPPGQTTPGFPTLVISGSTVTPGASSATTLSVAASGVSVSAPGVPVSTPGASLSAPEVPAVSPGVPVAPPGVPVSSPVVPVASPGVPVASPGVSVSVPGAPGLGTSSSGAAASSSSSPSSSAAAPSSSSVSQPMTLSTSSGSSSRSSVEPSTSSASSSSGSGSSSSSLSTSSSSSSSAAPPTTSTSSSSSSAAPSTTSTSSSTSSFSSSSTSASSSTATPQAALACPASNGATYTATDGSTWAIECSTDRWGGDINYFYRPTLEGCIELCESTANCRQVSWVIPPATGGDGTCYLKSASGTGLTNIFIWGAQKLTSATTTSTSSAASSAVTDGSGGGGGGGGAGWNGYPATSGAVVCPAANATVYTVPATGSKFFVLCGYDNNGNNMANNPRWAQTSSQAEELMAACDATSGCKWVTQGGSAGYFKETVAQSYKNANVNGFQKVSGSGITRKRDLPRMRFVKRWWVG